MLLTLHLFKKCQNWKYPKYLIIWEITPNTWKSAGKFPKFLGESTGGLVFNYSKFPNYQVILENFLN